MCPGLFTIKTLAKQKEYFYFECGNITLWPTVPFLEDLKVLANESTPNIKRKRVQQLFSVISTLLLFGQVIGIVQEIFNN